MNNETRNAVVSLLVENFGQKPFTFSALAKELGDVLPSRAMAYKVLSELVETGLVVRTKKPKGEKLVAAWAVNDSDEENNIRLWQKYLSA